MFGGEVIGNRGPLGSGRSGRNEQTLWLMEDYLLIRSCSVLLADF